MQNSVFHEQRLRGSFDFPVEFHYVDERHPNYQMPFHWHTEYEFVLVLEGSFKLSLDGKETPLQKGDVALIQGGTVHGGQPSECIYECMVLDLQQMLEFKNTSSSLNALLSENHLLISRYSNGSAVSLLADRMFEAMEKEYDGYEFTVKGLLFQILGELIKGKCYSDKSDINTVYAKRTRQLKNSLRLIRSNYQRPISLEELAAQADMSPKYFCRFFKEMVNRTPIDYLNYYRTERACEMLISGESNITEIALDCGFNDLSYFIKTFKKYKGLSPKQYQKANM